VSKATVFARSGSAGISDEGASPLDFVILLKPRVAALVAFTGLVGLVLADAVIHPILAATAIFCIAVGAGAAGAINMWYEADIDARMERTRNRPIPAGRMDPGAALGFGVFTAVASVVLIGLATNWLAAALLALAILFYVFVYTVWLKRRTPQNIVIGGAAGAIPPLIGWAAAAGEIQLYPVLLFAIIFMWTPPHFWALSLYKSGDYERAGVPMLPVVVGLQSTRRHIWVHIRAGAADVDAGHFGVCPRSLWSWGRAAWCGLLGVNGDAVAQRYRKPSAHGLCLFDWLSLFVVRPPIDRSRLAREPDIICRSPKNTAGDAVATLPWRGRWSG
jgi:protoheme IX farnesyltransferase